ncbi:MAG: HAMP domain-containing histidine kinase [Bacteroidales bacterium]|nr:HAMP domain-containing histidine kinase [Bacteroidales bacterium]
MKKRLFNYFIIMASVALLGVVITQVYWVSNAMTLKEEQFSGSVRIGMKSVLNQLVLRHNDSTLRQLSSPFPCFIEKTSVSDIIRPAVLDSLIKAEMGCMKISKDYVYAIYNRKTNRMAMGQYDTYREALINSDHQQSIGALISHGDYYLSLYFPNQHSMIIKQMIGWMLLSAALMLVVILSFWYTVNTVFRQKKISEMKTDFINNMTHEFKTPIATISLASEMLMKPEVNESADKIRKYASVIYDENNRLQNQVEQVLQIAILDKGETKLKPREIDVHRLLEKIAENFELQVRGRKGQIGLSLKASNAIITADKMHLMNVFSNLIDNAIKYSPEAPQINLSTTSDQHGIHVHISDKGIGIAPENQHLIFKNLFRVHTGDLHDVKGFGLGLYYVKRLIEMHQGNISVKSETGKGSVFSVFLPYKTNINQPDNE